MNIIYIPFFPIIADKTLFSSNHALADVVDDEDSFAFSPKADLTSPMYVHITLGIDTEADSSYFTKLLHYSQNILKILVFNCICCLKQNV